MQKYLQTIMKILHSSFFRAVCAVAIGILLLYHPDNTLKGITIAIGIIFLISGAISCISYFAARREADKAISQAGENAVENIDRPIFPIVGIGSLILGFILALMPETFIKWLMYVLGAIVILAAINQYMALINARKFWRMSGYFWVIPSLLLLTGLFVVIYPIQTAATPLIIIGVALIVYGISECVNSIAIHRQRKRYEQTTVEQTAIESLEVAEAEEVE